MLEMRERDLFSDQGWRDRLLGSLSWLDGSRRSLELAVEPARYTPATTIVRDGARHYQVAAGILRWAILQDQPRFSAAFASMRARPTFFSKC